MPIDAYEPATSSWCSSICLASMPADRPHRREERVDGPRGTTTVPPPKVSRCWWASGPRGFQSSLFLGEALDTERIDARYADGVLTLKLPVAEKAKPRRVPINISAGEHTAIDTNSKERVEASA